jgi:hypothetical protein
VNNTGAPGFVNVLIDWDQSGTWGGGVACPGGPAPEHVIVNLPVPPLYAGPLSGLSPSPRYQAIGRWQHAAGHATWTSDETWRPLPRREFSVRDDYDVLTGTNRVTILPLGWVHEEDNLKAVLDANGNVDAEIPYLAREAGVNRYEHIDGFDFSAGDDYWQSTAPFWRSVRAAWAARFAAHERLSVRSPEDAPPLFQVTFELADRFAGDAFDAAAARRAIDETLDRYVDGSGSAKPP